MRWWCINCLCEFDSNEDIVECGECGCRICKEAVNEYNNEGEIIESHHIHPRFMDNKKGKGKIYDINKRTHSKLHGKIMTWLWDEIKKEDREKAIENITKKSLKYIEEEDGK